MERWYGALAVVTDASSEVGGKIAEKLLKSGINVNRRVILNYAANNLTVVGCWYRR